MTRGLAKFVFSFACFHFPASLEKKEKVLTRKKTPRPPGPRGKKARGKGKDKKTKMEVR